MKNNNINIDKIIDNLQKDFLIDHINNKNGLVINKNLLPNNDNLVKDFDFNSFVCDFETSKYQIPKRNIKHKNKNYIGYICIFTFALLSSKSKLIQHNKQDRKKYIGVNEKDFNPYVYDCLDKQNLFFDCLNEMIEIIKKKNKNNKTIYLWFHNSSNFDSYYILDQLIKNNYVCNYDNLDNKNIKLFKCLANSKIGLLNLSFFYNGYEFIIKDSYKFTFNSIDNLGNMIGIKKLIDIGKEFYNSNYIKDLNLDQRKQYKNYAIRDIEILFNILPLWNNLIDLEKPHYLTLQSICIRQFKKLCENKKDLLKIDYEKWTNKHYKGGLTLLNPIYKSKIIENVKSYDINSSYPSSMLQLLPTYEIEPLNNINFNEWKELYKKFETYIKNNNIVSLLHLFKYSNDNKIGYLIDLINSYQDYLQQFFNNDKKLLDHIINNFNHYDKVTQDKLINKYFIKKLDNQLQKKYFHNLYFKKIIDLNIIYHYEINFLEQLNLLEPLYKYNDLFNNNFINPNNIIKLHELKIIKMKIKKDFPPLFPIPNKENEFYKTYEFKKDINNTTFILWDKELEYYQKFYNIEFEIINTRYFKQGLIFKEYVEYYYNQKANLSFENVIIDIILNYLEQQNKTLLNNNLNEFKQYWLNENNKMLIKSINDYEKEIQTLINYYCFNCDHNKQELKELLKQQKINNKVKINVVKLFLNSLYGKFGQDPHHKKYLYLNNNILKDCKNIEITKPLEQLKKNDSIYIYENINNELEKIEYKIQTIKNNLNKENVYIFECLERHINIKQANNIFIASYITMLSRLKLYDLIYELKNDFIYCDTDSVKTFKTIDKKYIDNLELGKWKHEYTTKFFKCLGAKRYIATNNKDNIHLDPKTKIKISSFNMFDKIVSLNDFKIGIELKRNGKIMSDNNTPIIYEKIYTLKDKKIECVNSNDNDLDNELIFNFDLENWE